MVFTSFMDHEDKHIERIYSDPTSWEALKKKLLDFYLYAVVPEVLTGCIEKGIPMYPYIFSYKLGSVSSGTMHTVNFMPIHM